MGRASGGSNTPHWIRNNILDFLRAMSVKIAVESGKICSKTTMREREILFSRQIDFIQFLKFS